MRVDSGRSLRCGRRPRHTSDVTHACLALFLAQSKAYDEAVARLFKVFAGVHTDRALTGESRVASYLLSHSLPVCSRAAQVHDRVLVAAKLHWVPPDAIPPLNAADSQRVAATAILAQLIKHHGADLETLAQVAADTCTCT